MATQFTDRRCWFCDRLLVDGIECGRPKCVQFLKELRQDEDDCHREQLRLGIKAAFQQRGSKNPERAIGFVEGWWLLSKLLICVALRLNRKPEYHWRTHDAVEIGLIDSRSVYGGWEAEWIEVGEGVFGGWWYSVEHDGETNGNELLDALFSEIGADLSLCR